MSERVTHISLDVSADDGEIWVSVTRCDALGRHVSSETRLIGGSSMVAVGRFIDRELARYPYIVSLSVEANVEGAGAAHER